MHADACIHSHNTKLFTFCNNYDDMHDCESSYTALNFVSCMIVTSRYTITHSVYIIPMAFAGRHSHNLLCQLVKRPAGGYSNGEWITSKRISVGSQHSYISIRFSFYQPQIGSQSYHQTATVSTAGQNINREYRQNSEQ